MEFKDKRVLVFGSGKSGIAAAELLMKEGVQLVLFEGNEEADIQKIREKTEAFAHADIYIGALPKTVICTLDMAVLSPGVPTDLPLVNRMRDAGVFLLGELELAFLFARGRLIAITGTNGKTTTTSLVGEILADYFEDTQVVGNIGIPYTSVAADTKDTTVTVAEVSSFQLETIHSFRPQVSAILNITPDHLNRHHTMENYIKAKEDITMNQDAEDICVLNYEDEVLRKFGEGLKTQVMYFSSKRPVEYGCYYKDDIIYYVSGGKTQQVVHVDELNILGIHNYENVMAAVCMTAAIGVPMNKIIGVLHRFQAVEHRIEYVTEKNGVRYYNDSKGTNPDAAIKGIQAMNRPTYLIGGGYDKQSEYDEWIESFDGKVRKLVLIGETKGKIAFCAKLHGFLDYVFADSLEEAVDICSEEAEPGEAVLLSPACASWDMFTSYEERGRIFKELVYNLKEQ